MLYVYRGLSVPHVFTNDSHLPVELEGWRCGFEPDWRLPIVFGGLRLEP